MRKPLSNVGASVRARLFALAKERNQPFDLLLTRYVLERFLYRLSISNHREHFILKGAMLLASWIEDPLRPTRDADFLRFGAPDAETVKLSLREICAITLNDAVEFDDTGFTVDVIREANEYGGLRMKIKATLDGARVAVAIDIGFGDAIEPGLTDVELPVLLHFPAPRLRAYARETVIAEKFQAMVAFGRANTRMKDFYDIWILSRSHEFTGDALARAIAATFARRNTEVPTELPDALTSDFAEDASKRQQWDTFVADLMAKPTPLHMVIKDLADFLMQHVAAARHLRETST
jgi:predicted nucleotidyltransferase component of viral defense system